MLTIDVPYFPREIISPIMRAKMSRVARPITITRSNGFNVKLTPTFSRIIVRKVRPETRNTPAPVIRRESRRSEQLHRKFVIANSRLAS